MVLSKRTPTLNPSATKQDMEMTHLDALQLRLSNERMSLANAKTEGEKELRKVWVAQVEKEIAGENKFIAGTDLSDDELMAELSK